jgi:hypothetical protein
MPGWNESQSQLQNWLQEARWRRDAHVVAADTYTKLHLKVGVPTVILSSIVGTTVFASLQSGDAAAWYVALGAGVLSVAAAILASLQTFFGFGEIAEKHRVASVRYGACVQQIEKVLALPEDLRGDVVECLEALSSRMESVMSDAPFIAPRFWRRLQSHATKSGRGDLPESVAATI